MKKTLFFFVLILSLCLVLCACDGGNTDGGNTDGGSTDGGSTDSGSTDGGNTDDGNTDDGGNDGENTLLSFTGISFADKTVVYNGTEQTLTLSGTLPEGTAVAYDGNVGTNAGTYTASVTLTKEGYQTVTLTAKLVIEKADYPAGILFESKTFVATGGEKSVLLSGTALPAGTEVVYANNTASAVGEYNATATLKNPNYKDKTLTATLTIKGVVVAAKEVIDSVMQRPDAWEFLPEAFSKENMAYTASSMPVTDFATSVNVSSISTRFVGSQMMVLYESLLAMESVLGKVDVVFAAGEAVASAYQSFINDNPDNYKEFTKTVAGFSVYIKLEGAKTTLLMGNATISAEFYIDGDANTYSGRISLTEGAALKYEMSDDSLTYAYKIGVGPAMRTSVVSFTREEDVTVGYLYQFTGVGGTGITTTAVFESDEDYTRIVAKKRESDDLIVLGSEEVYSSRTGKYVSGVVSETVKLADYETYWFNLADVSGFKNVSAVMGEKNGLNVDTIYLNGFKFNAKSNILSRRYDIEMKTVYYLQAIEKNGKTVYETVEAKIPMLFVQTKNYETFGDDVLDKNGNALSTEPVIAAGVADVAYSVFESMIALFDTISAFTYDTVVAYIGTSHSFFE